MKTTKTTKTMWAAALDYHRAVVVAQFLVTETPKQHQVIKSDEWNKTQWLVGYSTKINKDKEKLYDTKREALKALCIKLHATMLQTTEIAKKARGDWITAIETLETIS